MSAAFDKYVGSSVFKLSNSDGSEQIKGNIARLSKSLQVGCVSKIFDGLKKRAALKASTCCARLTVNFC